jgi:hypothetical protein
MELAAKEDLAAVPRLYLTGHPSITRREGATPDAPPEPCGFDPAAPFEERFRNLPGLTLPETLWAESFAAAMLAETMAGSALEHAWRLVDGHVAAFVGHGYCAEDSWIVRIPQSMANQVRPALGAGAPLNAGSGSVHPNPRGHEEYARSISRALFCDHYPDCDPSLPRRGAARPISGKKLLLEDVEDRPSERKIVLLSKSSEIAAPPPDPTIRRSAERCFASRASPAATTRSTSCPLRAGPGSASRPVPRATSTRTARARAAPARACACDPDGCSRRSARARGSTSPSTSPRRGPSPPR